MRLEDARLFLFIDEDSISAEDAATICGSAIAGGTDIIRLSSSNSETLAKVAQVCCNDDAIFLVTGNVPEGVNVDGVHLCNANDGIGMVRSVVGQDKIVGVSSSTLDEARLALEIGADYLVHDAGIRCPMDFAALRQEAGVPLFAGGMRTFDESKQVVDAGIYRICINISVCDINNLYEQMVQYSRLLGRSM